MTFKPKLWLGVGAVALAGSTASSLAQQPAHPDGARPGSMTLAQVGGPGGEGGESGEGGERGGRGARGSKGFLPSRAVPHKSAGDRAKPKKKSGAGGGGEGGERGQFRGNKGGGGERGDVGGYPRSSREGGERGDGGEAGVNTRYIFGFTEGADTERAGEREIENDTVGRFGKRTGSFTALQNKSELEYGVTNDLTVAAGSFLSQHRIRSVPDLDDRNNGAFDGFFAEAKYRILDRRVFPFGLAISAEPEWRRHSETSGNREDAFGVELKLYADKELLPNQLFIAGNLLFEPEAVRVNEFDPDIGRTTKWEHESTFGVSGAIAGAVAPGFFLGAEVRYLSHFEGSFLNKFEGEAVFVGPTLSVRFLPRAVVQAAFSAQVAGKSVDEPNRSLDLVNFERRQARARLVIEF
ncbi:MAG: hypothetical protein ACJ8D4_20070 [Xanthobacteraceae bacterium]